MRVRAARVRRLRFARCSCGSALRVASAQQLTARTMACAHPPLPGPYRVGVVDIALDSDKDDTQARAQTAQRWRHDTHVF